MYTSCTQHVNDSPGNVFLYLYGYVYGKSYCVLKKFKISLSLPPSLSLSLLPSIPPSLSLFPSLSSLPPSLSLSLSLSFPQEVTRIRENVYCFQFLLVHLRMNQIMSTLRKFSDRPQPCISTFSPIDNAYRSIDDIIESIRLWHEKMVRD